jgi:xanthine dehydrogenase accessory factor
MPLFTLIRGGGDLASGVAVRLHRSGLQVLITELPSPLVVRRMVAFAEAVFSGVTEVESVTARRVDGLGAVLDVFEHDEIAVLVDPEAEVIATASPAIIVDARMLKIPPGAGLPSASLSIGLGPGFTAGLNCHAAVETRRGHSLGRVLWKGSPEADTGIPESVGAYGAERVLRAPGSGVLTALAEIGDRLQAGQPVAEVHGELVTAPFQGVLRGLVHPGVQVAVGMKIGDVDPRDDPCLCFRISDKALAVAGGVMEAIFATQSLRSHLWT